MDFALPLRYVFSLREQHGKAAPGRLTIVTNPLSWNQARQACEATGMVLAMITTAELAVDLTILGHLLAARLAAVAPGARRVRQLPLRQDEKQ